MKIKRDTTGEILFWTATVVGFAVYFLSAPAGLPWSGSTRAALAWAGEITELPYMPNPVWGYFIQVFGGRFIALSSLAASLSAGLIAAIVNRYLGWRVGAAAAVTWIFLPSVWNRAVTGSRSVFWVFGAVLALWIVNALFLFLTRRVRRVVAAEGNANAEATLASVDRIVRKSFVSRTVGWSLLGVSLLFAVVSTVGHDFMIGEVASAYARAILAEADGRLVVMGGVADDQMIWEAERREAGSSSRLIMLRNDDAYRAALVSRVKRDWPGETNLWVAAQIGVQAFADLAVRRHPERVYLMTGSTTTPEKWASRWEAMKPMLDSSDPFVPVMRRAFAFEANALANQLQDDGRLAEAWRLYWRIVEEVDDENVSAYVNLSEMLRRGYVADVQKRRRIEDEMAKLRKGLANRRTFKRTVAKVSICGPVRPDAQAMAEIKAEYSSRMAELEKNGEKSTLPYAFRSLLEHSDEMIRAFNTGNLKKAGRIARAILSRRDGRGFVPAHAVMGAVMAKEGDFVASEAFYRTALSGEGKPPVAVYNDYADTLKHLGRLDEAEQYARLGIAATPETGWIFRLTLAEILRDAGKNPEEVKSLLKVVSRYAPEKVHSQVKKEFLRE